MAGVIFLIIMLIVILVSAASKASKSGQRTNADAYNSPQPGAYYSQTPYGVQQGTQPPAPMQSASFADEASEPPPVMSVEMPAPMPVLMDDGEPRVKLDIDHGALARAVIYSEIINRPKFGAFRGR